MAEPVKIGDQTFVKTGSVWIDKKTKQPADKGLIALLDSVAGAGASEAAIKTRIKIDRNREPVTIAGTKYVYDLNQQSWIDEKTKKPVDPNFTRVLDAAVLGDRQTARTGTEEQAGKAFGYVTEAAAQNINKPTVPKTGQGAIPVRVNTKMNTPIVAMIEKLATIDSYLKQRLDNQKTISDRNVAVLKEQAIEQQDAQKIDLKGEGTNEENKSNAAAIIAAVGLGTIIASQFDPVKEAFKSVVDFSKSVYGFFGSFVDVINNGLKGILGDSSAVPVGAVKAIPTANGGTRLQAEPGYNLTAAADGSQYVSRQGSNEGFKVNQNAQTGTPSIDYNQRASINTEGAPIGFGTQSSPLTGSPGMSSPGSSGSSSVTMPTATPISTPPASAPAATPVTPAAPAAPAATPTTTDDRNWWQRTMPTWLGGEDAPSDASATQNQAAPGQFPQNDIVGLGRQLQAQGILVGEHSAFGGVGEHSTNSRHYRDQAIDLNIVAGRDADNPVAAARFDALKPQLEAAGYNVLWRTKGHYDHMHVSTGGPEGSSGGEYTSLLQDAGSAVSASLETAAKFIKSIGKELVGERRFVSMASQTADPSTVIGRAQVARMSAIADARTDQPAPPPPSLPNLNAGKPNMPVQNPPTQSDRSGSLHYLERQGLSVQ